MSFAGKGYRLNISPSRRNTLTFSFGHSHLYYIYFLESAPRKESKTKIIFFGLNTFLLKNSTLNLFRSKPLNIFT